MRLEGAVGITSIVCIVVEHVCIVVHAEPARLSQRLSTMMLYDTAR